MKIKKKPIEFINSDPKLGIIYDWDYIFKLYNKLNVPTEFYSPTHVPIHDCKYFVGVSERSTGKTTNWLLIGLILHEVYGTVTQYIRQSADMIAPKNIKRMFDVIIQHGYISEITGGKFNNIIYRARNWFYQRTENGEIVETSEEPVLYCLDLDENETYKSSYNAPMGDLIIFDEFISSRYYPNEFVTFSDLVKTIIRERQSPIIVMLANTTDRYNTYFSELNIQDIILSLKLGESATHYTDKGTGIFCELIGNQNPTRVFQNSLFFGFKNPRLASITGGDWSIDNYPHIMQEDCKTLNDRHYIRYNGFLVQLEICQNKRLGTFIKAHKATRLKKLPIVYTLDFINSTTERFKFGYTSVDKMIFALYSMNKWYYSNNEVGNVVKSYISQAKKYIL